MQLAPSVWPWNCLGERRGTEMGSAWLSALHNGEEEMGSPSGAAPRSTHRTRLWFCRSHTTMLPSLQQEKQTLASGLMARA